MTQCLKITLVLTHTIENLLENLRTKAQSYRLEGTAQLSEQNLMLKISVCGNGEKIDQFLDFIHQITIDCSQEGPQLEPFIRQKDYRGVFRIIE